ncbi:Pescadillo N-terminus-domain-containing protein [Mortierella sp. GBAus27b]|nr:mRNA-binding ribosome synthesis protein nop7 [Mortierella sp. GBA43]KAI8346232.1 Pescadillo N-terminus-domain-containing protein [Mortierella sp. GBAus27b]
MGKLQKKGKAGAAINYITRNQALKKLQVTLADFRRLCILKGIYPREPKNKKKANKGSTAPTTFYYAKDIQYLLHEPVLVKFREYKTFAKKMAKVLSKGQLSTAKTLAENKPVYTLDHIVKERYPSFTDALRDLDDALCMVFLFATMPKTDKLNSETIESCQRLAAEFQHYVMYTRSLRKVFLSIKGIYYQAEIKGQTITWLVPYQFSQDVPTDVDFRVMLTFLEFYQTLCGFVNFKLYSDVNLVYPPKLDIKLEEGGAGMNALLIESTQSSANISKIVNGSSSTTLSHEEKQRLQETEKRIQSLTSKIARIQEVETTTNGTTTTTTTITTEEDTLEEFPAPLPNLDGTSSATVTISDIQRASQHLTQFQSLFSQCYIFLSREVPRYSLEFILRACGGNVGWDAVLGEGSPFDENDERITHQISDKPTQGHRFLSRQYVQPQWGFDSINAGRILASEPYHIGKTLPPHLSPFVEAKEGDYVPDENQFEGQTEDLEMQSEDDDDEEDDDEEDEDDEDEEDEDEDEEDEEAEHKDLHQRELEAEAKGVVFTEFEASENKKKAKVAKAAKKEATTTTPAAVPETRTAGKKRTAAEIEEAENKELAKIMMTNKQQKLYNKIQYGKNKKAAEVEKLTKRKEQLAKDAKAASKKKAKK